MIQTALALMLLAASPVSTPQVNTPRVDPYGPARYFAVQERHVLVLYYTSYCPYSQKVLRYLNKIHKTIPMKNLENDPQAKAELKRIGGRMQVPCLVIDGQALYESDAIIDWLSQHQDELDPA